MNYREFRAPDEVDLFDALGDTATIIDSGDPDVRSFAITVDDKNELTFSYSLPGRSIRVLWHYGGDLILDIFREGATRLEIQRDSHSSFVIVEFSVDSIGGQLEIQIKPRIAFKDQMLFS